MIPIHAATRGFISTNLPLGIASDGLISAAITPPPFSGGGGGGIGWAYKGDRDFDERLVLRKRILRDDEDILSFVGAIIPYLH